MKAAHAVPVRSGWRGGAGFDDSGVATVWRLWSLGRHEPADKDVTGVAGAPI